MVGLAYLGEAVGAEPRGVGGPFGGALRVAETSGQHPAVHDSGPVRGEDHVRQTGQGVDQLDGVSQRDVQVTQFLPLRDGKPLVDRFAEVHPWIDRVGDVEMGRRTHEVSPPAEHTRVLIEHQGCLRRAYEIPVRSKCARFAFGSALNQWRTKAEALSNSFS